MKWIKHITDSLEDPFINDLMEDFGPWGYMAFFGILELYGREFKIKDGWFLQCSLKLLAAKLKSFNVRRIKTFLKHSKLNEKWEIKLIQNKRGLGVTIYIPKFIDLIDDTTKKRMRDYEEKHRNKSGIKTDSIRNIEEEEEEEEERDKRSTKKPAPQASSSDDEIPFTIPKTKPRHFSHSVGDYFQSIKKSCDAIKTLPSKNGGGFNPYQFVQKAVNRKGHPKAIDDTLKGIIKVWDDIEKPWPYIESAFKTINGNCNEREAIKIHEQMKAMRVPELEKLTRGMIKEV